MNSIGRRNADLAFRSKVLGEELIMDQERETVIPTAKENTLTTEKVSLLATSTKPKELSKFSIAQLTVELERLKKHLDNAFDDFPVLQKGSQKVKVVKALASVRKDAFELDPSLKEELEAEALSSCKVSTSLKLRQDELSDVMFTFEGCKTLASSLGKTNYEIK
jgi:hypothetical protein